MFSTNQYLFLIVQIFYTSLILVKLLETCNDKNNPSADPLTSKEANVQNIIAIIRQSLKTKSTTKHSFLHVNSFKCST